VIGFSFKAGSVLLRNLWVLLYIKVKNYRKIYKGQTDSIAIMMQWSIRKKYAFPHFSLSLYFVVIQKGCSSYGDKTFPFPLSPGYTKKRWRKHDCKWHQVSAFVSDKQSDVVGAAVNRTCAFLTWVVLADYTTELVASCYKILLCSKHSQLAWWSTRG
jgi:hypothetical protein